MNESDLEWASVGQESDLPDGRVKTVTVGKISLCLSHFDGQWAAMDSRCPHQGGPLGEGSIEDCCLGSARCDEFRYRIFGSDRKCTVVANRSSASGGGRSQ